MFGLIIPQTNSQILIFQFMSLYVDRTKEERKKKKEKETDWSIQLLRN